MTALVAVGVAFRLWLNARAGWRIEYDEAMLGLMARGILDGQHSAFIPAQPTLGTLEVYLLAGLFALFGPSAAVMRAESLLYAIVYIVGIGWAARLAFDRPTGLAAALMAAIVPMYAVTVGGKIWGGTMSTLIFGVLLIAVTIATTRATRHRGRWFAALGLLAGVMFWTAFLSAYFLLPVAVIIAAWLLHQRRDAGWRAFGWVTVSLVAFMLGSAPFWWHNATHNWETFRLTLGGGHSSPDQLRAIAAHLWADIIPRLASGDPAWGGLGASARRLMGWLYIGGAAYLMWAGVARRTLAAALLALVTVAVPLIYISSDFARNALNPYGIDATGRYVLMWHAVWPIGAAALAITLGRRWRIVGAGLLALMVTLNLLGAMAAHPLRPFDSPYYDRQPDDLAPVIAALDASDVQYVWTDVGLAQLLMFYTDERIIAADYWDVQAGGLLRFPEAYAAVLTASEVGERVAYVEAVKPEQVAPPIEAAFDAADVRYTAEQVGGLRVYLPEAPLHPSAVAGGLGWQY